MSASTDLSNMTAAAVLPFESCGETSQSLRVLAEQPLVYSLQLFTRLAASHSYAVDVLRDSFDTASEKPLQALVGFADLPLFHTAVERYSSVRTVQELYAAPFAFQFTVPSFILFRAASRLIEVFDVRHVFTAVLDSCSRDVIHIWLSFLGFPNWALTMWLKYLSSLAVAPDRNMLDRLSGLLCSPTSVTVEWSSDPGFFLALPSFYHTPTLLEDCRARLDVLQGRVAAFRTDPSLSGQEQVWSAFSVSELVVELEAGRLPPEAVKFLLSSAGQWDGAVPLLNQLNVFAALLSAERLAWLLSTIGPTHTFRYGNTTTVVVMDSLTWHTAALSLSFTEYVHLLPAVTLLTHEPVAAAEFLRSKVAQFDIRMLSSLLERPPLTLPQAAAVLIPDSN